MLQFHRRHRGMFWVHLLVVCLSIICALYCFLKHSSITRSSSSSDSKSCPLTSTELTPYANSDFTSPPSCPISESSTRKESLNSSSSTDYHKYSTGYLFGLSDLRLVTINHSLSYEFETRAAHMENKLGMIGLAYRHLWGIGVPRSCEVALKIYRNLTQQMNLKTHQIPSYSLDLFRIHFHT